MKFKLEFKIGIGSELHEGRIDMASRFFANDGGSSSEETTESESEAEEEQRQWVQESSSESEEEGRVVVSHRDRNMMSVIEQATGLKKTLRIADYSKLLDEMNVADKLIMGKARTMIAKEGIPKQYSHMLVTIEDHINVIAKATLRDKKKFSRARAQAVQKVRARALCHRRGLLRLEPLREPFPRAQRRTSLPPPHPLPRPSARNCSHHSLPPLCLRSVPAPAPSPLVMIDPLSLFLSLVMSQIKSFYKKKATIACYKSAMAKYRAEPYLAAVAKPAAEVSESESEEESSEEDAGAAAGGADSDEMSDDFDDDDDFEFDDDSDSDDDDEGAFSIYFSFDRMTEYFTNIMLLFID